MHRPHEFVGAALCELAETVAAMSADNTGEVLASQPGQVPRQGATAAQRSLLEDLIYCWALAEAYIQHPQLQADMRCARVRCPFIHLAVRLLLESFQKSCEYCCKALWLTFTAPCRSALGRDTPGALAAGPDRLNLESRVQLLEGAHQGQYMIGSVRFAPALPGVATAETPSTSGQSRILWGGDPAASTPRVHLIGPEYGQMLVAYEVTRSVQGVCMIILLR